MKILKLPFYDLLEKIHKLDYPSLEFNNKTYWMLLIILISILVACTILVSLICKGFYNYFDYKNSLIEFNKGELIDKKYIGESQSSGIGTAFIPSNSGSVGIVSASSKSEEEFLFFIKADKVYKIPVNMQQFYSYSIGQKIGFETKIGRYSKKELSSEINQ